MTAPQDAPRRGWLRRVIDWLLWDGEEDLDERAPREGRTSGTHTVRSERVEPPKHSVDSIDWIAFAEGRPQADNGTMIAKAEHDLVEDLVEVPPDSGVHTALQYDADSNSELAAEAPAPESVQEAVVEVRAAPSTRGVPAQPVPTTAELMASIEWD